MTLSHFLLSLLQVVISLLCRSIARGSYSQAELCEANLHVPVASPRQEAEEKMSMRLISDALGIVESPSSRFSHE